MSVNLNFQVPPLPQFKNYTVMKMKEKLYGANGENEKKSEPKQEEEKTQSKRGPTPRWLKLLMAALFVAIALPVIAWILDRIANLIRAAKGVEAACVG